MRFALSLLILVAVPSVALADDGLHWRRTTPRATLAEERGVLEIGVPAGRAWGVQSSTVAIEPSRTYRVVADFAVPRGIVRAFVRVAFYPAADGRGRQLLRLDSLAVGAGETAERSVTFVAPDWARAAKVRLLVRREGGVEPSPLVRAHGALLRVLNPVLPEVVLREDPD